MEHVPANDYDTVELRTGRLHKIRRSQARLLGEEDRIVQVVKCYCRSHDVVTAADAELQQRPTFVFPAQFFKNLESLIGRELEGRIYSDSQKRRVKFYLDLKEHAGFQLEENHNDLQSPWYDEGVLKE
ncbi:MAG TPA: hypothetical protein VLE22_11850 [Bryobacteraceae bacterium]|nr:hypothetical protein [Bryobacteraceae bacterium]